MELSSRLVVRPFGISVRWWRWLTVHVCIGSGIARLGRLCGIHWHGSIGRRTLWSSILGDVLLGLDPLQLSLLVEVVVEVVTVL